jgi:hypothetical protein
MIAKPVPTTGLFGWICRIEIMGKRILLQLSIGDTADPRWVTEIGAQLRRLLTTTQTFQQRVKASYQSSGIGLGHSPLKPFRI